MRTYIFLLSLRSNRYFFIFGIVFLIAFVHFFFFFTTNFGILSFCPAFNGVLLFMPLYTST